MYLRPNTIVFANFFVNRLYGLLILKKRVEVWELYSAGVRLLNNQKN